MKNLESMKWCELPKKDNHPIPVQDLSPEAQSRLRELKRNDIDSVFSMHLMGKPRIIGIRDRHVLKLLWWDPQHKVCPSHKKHT
jgi:hypothetical protein